MLKINFINVTKPFKYIWLKSVIGVNLSVHCARCLCGTYSKAVNADMKHSENIVLENGIYYLCGVSKPYVWKNNFHLAFEYCEGQTLYFNDNGIEVEIENAVALPIDTAYIDSNDPHFNDKPYYTCRNWQFAHYIKQRNSLESK